MRRWPGSAAPGSASCCLSFHLLNGIRHLFQDFVWGYEIHQFVRNGFITSIGSLVLTALLWIGIYLQWGGA